MQGSFALGRWVLFITICEKGVILNLRKAFFLEGPQRAITYIMDKSEKLAAVALYHGTPTIFYLVDLSLELFCER
jgi:hypothetical protein